MKIAQSAIRYSTALPSPQSAQLVLRACAIILSLLHLVVFVSYFIPYMDDPRVNLWQALLPWSGLFAYSRAPLAFIVSNLFLPLLLPACAAWITARCPVRIISLVSVWISIPLLFVAWFFWTVLALELYAPASGLQGVVRLVIFVPACGLALSFPLCLALARYQRLLLASEKVTFSLMQPEHLPDVPAAKASHPSLAEDEPQRLSAGARRLLLSLSVPAFLCNLLVFVSLSFPYISFYDSVRKITWSTTGWQMLGQDSPSVGAGIFLLVIPLLPALASLIGRLPIPVTPAWKDALFVKSIALSYWLMMLCFMLSGIVLEYSLLFIGANAPQERHWLAAAPGLPVAGFLLALICIGILRGHMLHRRSQAHLA